MIFLQILLQLFLTNPSRTVQTCMSTTFGQNGDRYGGRTPTLLYKRPVRPGDMGIAHREWPIGARIKITNLKTQKTAFGRVIDRGTYGMRDARGWFNSRRPGNEKRTQDLVTLVGEDNAHCGCADLTPDLAKAIGHRGKTRVRITLLRSRQWHK